MAQVQTAPAGGFPGVFRPQKDVVQFERFSPEVREALSQLLQMGLSGVQQTGAGFRPIREQALQEFQERIVPSLAERFASPEMQRTGAFRQALGRSATDLESALAGLESQYNLRQQQQLQNLLQLGLTPRYETAYQEAPMGFLQSAGRGILSGLGRALPSLLLGV